MSCPQLLEAHNLPCCKGGWGVRKPANVQDEGVSAVCEAIQSNKETIASCLKRTVYLGKGCIW